ncbi:MAG: ribonuclease HI family protein [Candidatus Neomarinimicrobiota bacterium]|jgi:ribonuclease HI|nr:ribonuclease HI family protein [Candidatus Neomarinimicrobiota bacterium]MED5433467.1 ribonuclease HI family protein [Candidatus Neomarinimicrobiota bacterium]|tara:strand:+ start:502 stop:1011 length:510 start_codon:yes stop_codon:yes gene_type:complete
MNFDQKEIGVLIELLEREDAHNNPELKNIYDKLVNTNHTYTMYVDGAADLHSKTSGIGGVVYKDEVEILSFSEYLDDSTNNEAEYGALIYGLKLLLKSDILNINIYSDSELIVKQINGHYKVKNDRMKKLYKETYSLLSKFKSWSCTHVLRDKNKVADKLATDGRLKGK